MHCTKICTNRMVAICTAALALALPVQAAGKTQKLAPESTIGSWTGLGYQLDDAEAGSGQFSSWGIELTISPDRVMIAYPSLDCGGVWKLERTTAHASYYRETITYGLENCMDQGLSVLSAMDDGRMRIEYYHPDDVFIAIGYVDPRRK